MSQATAVLNKTFCNIGATRKGKKWYCPYCQHRVFQAELIGEEVDFRVCCAELDADLRAWGAYDLIENARRMKEDLTQRHVPGVKARKVRDGIVAGPLATEVVSKTEVSEAIQEYHKHHSAPHSAILGVLCTEEKHDGEDVTRGVGTLATPTARKLMEKGTHLEVNRLCTWGPKWRRHNVISKLTGRLRKEARRLRQEAQQNLGKAVDKRAKKRRARRAGIGRLRTYILENESGKSLRAAGWKLVGRSEGGSWANSRQSRTKQPQTEGPKWIYDTTL